MPNGVSEPECTDDWHCCILRRLAKPTTHRKCAELVRFPPCLWPVLAVCLPPCVAKGPRTTESLSLANAFAWL